MIQSYNTQIQKARTLWYNSWVALINLLDHEEGVPLMLAGAQQELQGVEALLHHTKWSVESIKASPDVIKPFTSKDVKKQLTLLTREEELLHTLIMGLQTLVAPTKGKKAVRKIMEPSKSPSHERPPQVSGELQEERRKLPPKWSPLCQKHRKRNPTAISLELSHSMRFIIIRKVPSCSSGSCPSAGWSVRSPMS